MRCWGLSNVKRSRKFGFRARRQTKAGRAIILARRRKGRSLLSATFNRAK